MPSWAINSTKLSNYIKLNKMSKTLKSNETAQLVIGGVSGCLLPTKLIIDKVIIEEYINRYGTNYDEYSLENAREGALIIVSWILNNR